MTKRTLVSAAICLIIVAATAAAAIQERREARMPTSGEPIVFHAVESAQDRAIIQDIVARADYGGFVENLPAALERGELRISEQDINQDGTPEYWVMETSESFCNEYGCATQLFWLLDGRWQRPVKYMFQEGKVWGAKRPGFRDYVVITERRRAIFPFYEGRIIEARPLRTDEEKAVALDYIQRHIAVGIADDPEETPDFWREKIDNGSIKLIEADLNDDGQIEWIVVVEIGAAYCGQIGCDSVLLRKSGKTWQLMTGLSIAGFMMLDDKKFGWHRIYTGEEIYTLKDGQYFESVTIDDARISRDGYADPPY